MEKHIVILIQINFTIIFFDTEGKNYIVELADKYYLKRKKPGNWF